MKHLAIIAALLPVPALACDLVPDGAFVIAYTDHLGAEPIKSGWGLKANPFDEGAGIRGGGVTFECNGYEVSASGYKNSIVDGGNGYTLALTNDNLSLSAGSFEVRPLAQINYYPQQSETFLEETNGWFPSFGLSFRYDVADDVGIYVNFYPTLGLGESFDSLLVAGVSVRW